MAMLRLQVSLPYIDSQFQSVRAINFLYVKRVFPNDMLCYVITFCFYIIFCLLKMVRMCVSWIFSPRARRVAAAATS
jgi:hypothetical protein